MRNEIFNALFDNATDQPVSGKWYIFEYDPKFKDQLKTHIKILFKKKIEIA